MSAAMPSHRHRRAAGGGATRRGWRRRVLGVLAFALPWREEKQNQAIRSPQRPIDAPAGSWAHYEGARWRVVETELLPAGGFGSDLDTRDDDAMLVVRFEVIPDRNILGKTLDSCQGRVSDDRGRHWEANPLPLSRYRGKLQRRCGTRSTADFRTEQALGGRPFRFDTSTKSRRVSILRICVRNCACRCRRVRRRARTCALRWRRRRIEGHCAANLPL